MPTPCPSLAKSARSASCFPSSLVVVMTAIDQPNRNSQRVPLESITYQLQTKRPWYEPGWKSGYWNSCNMNFGRSSSCPGSTLHQLEIVRWSPGGFSTPGSALEIRSDGHRRLAIFEGSVDSNRMGPGIYGETAMVTGLLCLPPMVSTTGRSKSVRVLAGIRTLI